MNLPEGLQYWTADEVAECLGYHQHLTEQEADNLYSLLWQLVDDATNPTPLGGDGTDGTVECPGDRLSLKNDDKTGHWWKKLDADQQRAIVAAYEKEMER